MFSIFDGISVVLHIFCKFISNFKEFKNNFLEPSVRKNALNKKIFTLNLEKIEFFKFSRILLKVFSNFDRIFIIQELYIYIYFIQRMRKTCQTFLNPQSQNVGIVNSSHLPDLPRFNRNSSSFHHSKWVVRNKSLCVNHN